MLFIQHSKKLNSNQILLSRRNGDDISSTISIFALCRVDAWQKPFYVAISQAIDFLKRSQVSLGPTLNLAMKNPIVSSGDDGSNLWTSSSSPGLNHSLWESGIRTSLRIIKQLEPLIEGNKKRKKKKKAQHGLGHSHKFNETL